MFRFGLDQFLGEARTLAQLDHPNIVRVRQFFEANGTAYLVMDYYQGVTLAEHLERQGGRVPEEQAKQLMLPILDGLRAVHAKGFLHRDIKPQNIYLARMDSGGVRPILLDFGAARLAMGERSRSLSVVLTPGFAPFEQYHRKGKQGPWTDIYGAAAVLYRMVTGVTPPEATERRDGDELRPATAYGVSPALSQALAEALALVPEARPQTVQTFQALLLGAEGCSVSSESLAGTGAPIQDAGIGQTTVRAASEEASRTGWARAEQSLRVMFGAPAEGKPRSGWEVLALIAFCTLAWFGCLQIFRDLQLALFGLSPIIGGALFGSAYITTTVGAYLWRNRLLLTQGSAMVGMIWLSYFVPLSLWPLVAEVHGVEGLAILALLLSSGAVLIGQYIWRNRQALPIGPRLAGLCAFTLLCFSALFLLVLALRTVSI